MDNLRHYMQVAACKGITDDRTLTAYKAQIGRFSTFCAGTYGKSQIRTDMGQIERVAAVQAYTDQLVSDGKSAATIHSYVSPVCKGMGIRYDMIQHPVRHAADITRSRGLGNDQGAKEAQNGKYERLTAFQSAVGIRRAELSDLRGRDLVERDGSMYVHVAQGKGGKEQYQLILPQHEHIVRDTFAGVASDAHVFTRAEMANKIDLHGLRAEHARECYAYFVDRLQQDPGLREEYNRQMDTYFRQQNDMARPEIQRTYARFRADCLSGGTYTCRGGNATRARMDDRPVAYDRTALAMVSVFDLSHWRTDVTVTNYML